MASRTLGAAETGGGMDYRLFLMADGHVRRAREFVMADDAEAIVHADRLREGEAAELWRRVVRIRSFAKDPQATAPTEAGRGPASRNANIHDRPLGPRALQATRPAPDRQS